MRSLAIVKENLDNQRQAVQEERRQGVDNQPYGRTNEAIDELAFDNPAYKHSVIGSMDDLNAASTQDVAAFFQTYYAPNNAIIAVAGDVDHGRRARAGAQVLRVDPGAAGAAAGRRQPGAAAGRAPPRDRRSAGAAAAARHRLSHPVGRRAGRRRRRRADGAAGDGRSSRFYEPSSGRSSSR